ncbi:MAG: FAD-dependent oxidoreductase [Haliscomenobacter sp.]|nr:FAD-dependent oxidoreductase [Haliscomenobacter sp.]MBP9874262.1 FAD-dependent oxidoreductase [Haliscomenobacter sp.]
MKNKLFFKIGIFMQLVLLIAHLVNNRNGLPIPVVDEESRLLTFLMKTYDIHFSGGWRTLDETLWGYAITWALFVVFTFLASIQVLLVKPQSRLLGRRITFANVLLWAGCLVATLLFWSLPQQALFGLVLAPFLLSYLLEWKAPKPNSTRICVVGAGVSGLTAAYQLQKQGYTQVTVLEKANYAGGKCLSVEHYGHPFDLGGHEMLAGYRDVMEMAAELGAPARVSIPPMVYDHDTRQYLNFKKAAVASGKYSMPQVVLASMKYLFLVAFPFRRFSKPSTGYSRMPKELAMPLSDWLVKRRLTALSDILAFVVKVQGYGHFNDTSAAYLVKFMGLQNWLSLILSGMGISKQWPKVFTYGMLNFCERIAAGLKVHLNTEIERIERQTGNAAEPVRIFIKGKPEPLVFDKMILCTPLEAKGLGFLDMSPEEDALFRQFTHYQFVNTVCHTQGLPAGVVASIPLNDIQRGEYTGYIKDFTDVPVSVFFSLASPGVTDPDLREKIKEVLKDIPEYEGKKPEVLEFLNQKNWDYFPHVLPEAVAGGFYDKLEALQGERHTFYASSALAFECVGNSVAYAKRLVLNYF